MNVNSAIYPIFVILGHFRDFRATGRSEMTGSEIKRYVHVFPRVEFREFPMCV